MAPQSDSQRRKLWLAQLLLVVMCQAQKHYSLRRVSQVQAAQDGASCQQRGQALFTNKPTLGAAGIEKMIEEKIAIGAQ